MYGGKRVGETLAWEEVLSFYIQFVLGSAKEFKLKPQKLWAPTTKKLRMVPCWGQCARCMGEKGLGKHWLGRKCCLFTLSLCLGQQKNLNSNLKNFGPQPQKSFVWCHVGDNVRDAWGKNGWRNTGLRGSAVFLNSVCAWVSKGISAQNLKSSESCAWVSKGI